jgi:serine O-acetyltransferase
MNRPQAHLTLQALRQLAWLSADFAHLRSRDPALSGKRFATLEALTYPGLWAVAVHRVAHILHAARLPVLPRLLSQFNRLLTGIEIHPAARIGPGFFIDHGNGVVIGETAEIGAHVLMFHQVTLGNAIVDSRGKRHPTIGDHVVLGAGAKVLGPIVIGDHSIVGAGTVVTRSAPAHSVLVGTAARRLARRPLAESIPFPAAALEAKAAHPRRLRACC